ncbi:MAG: hypothetical protein GF418_12610 [Chitinivibrionales bacterium]|nr:hypothetical protein [Chitinivibrionales bacterium]MBD3396461.1 hypothetical protein [Chitinivibrionales bacterium]
MRASNENIERAIDCARELLFLADKGDMQREDEECGVLFGIIRDTGYQIRRLAQKERERHRQRGTWDDDTGMNEARAIRNRTAGVRTDTPQIG